MDVRTAMFVLAVMDIMALLDVIAVMAVMAFLTTLTCEGEIEDDFISVFV